MIESPVYPTGNEGLNPPLSVSPRRDLENQFEFEPFDPRTVSAEVFSTLPGEIQEFALKYLIKDNDKESIARLRRDFQMDRQPTAYEISLTHAINGITLRESPIYDSDSDSKFSFIRTFVNKSEPELVRKLESERQRRSAYPDSLFYSHEPIGQYQPAIRYRILLEDKAKQEVEEEQVVAEEVEAEATRRRVFDEDQARKDRERVAEIRIELTTIQGGKAA